MATRVAKTTQAASAARRNPYPYGSLGMYGIILIFVILSILLKVDFRSILSEIWSLYVHGPATITEVTELPLATLTQQISGLLVIDMAVMLVSIVILSIVFRNETKAEGPTLFEILLQKTLDNGPREIFNTIYKEELYSRALLLWLIWDLLLGRATWAFYLMFLLGNGVWALIHIFNHEPGKRSILKVMPQFLGGVLLTYVFVKYGFWVTLLVHWFYDVALFASFREQPVKPSDIVDIVYFPIVGGAAMLFLSLRGISLNTFAPWFTTISGEITTSHSLLDYLLFFALILSLLRTIAAGLLLDKPTQPESWANDFDQSFPSLIFEYATYFALVIGTIALGNWLLSLLELDVAAKALVLAMIAVLSAKTTSGSSLARETFIMLPVSVIVMLVFQTQGFWAAMAIMATKFVLELPSRYVETKRDSVMFLRMMLHDETEKRKASLK